MLFENAHKVGKGIEATGVADLGDRLVAGNEKRFCVIDFEAREVFDIGDPELLLEFFGNVGGRQPHRCRHIRKTRIFGKASVQMDQNMKQTGGGAVNLLLHGLCVKQEDPDDGFQKIDADPQKRIALGRIVLLLAHHVPVFWIYDTQPLWINLLTAFLVFCVMLFVFRKDIAGFVQKFKEKKNA